MYFSKTILVLPFFLLFCIQACSQEKSTESGTIFTYQMPKTIDATSIQKVKEIITNRVLHVYNQKPNISYDDKSYALKIDIPNVITTKLSDDTLQVLLRSKGQFGLTLGFKPQKVIHDFLDHVDSLSRETKVKSLKNSELDYWLYSRFEKIKPSSNLSHHPLPFYGICHISDTVPINEMLIYPNFRTNNSENIGWFWKLEGEYITKLYAYNKTDLNLKVNKKMITRSSVTSSKQDKTAQIEIEFDKKGSSIFKVLTTTASLNKNCLHVYLDKRLLSSPYVMSKIENGKFTLSMGEKVSLLEMKCIEAIITNEPLPFELPLPDIIRRY
jgi:hypothetical protein